MGKRLAQPSVSNAGFTLVEVLVSVALSLIIVSFICDGVRFGTQAWRVGAAGDATQANSAAIGLLRNLLESAFPLREKSSAGAGALMFRGLSDRLLFATLSEGNTRLAGISTVSIYNGVDAVKVYNGVLLLRPSGSQKLADVTDVPVLQGARVRFSYFGCERGANHWYDEWFDRQKLPDIVRLHIVWPENNHFTSSTIDVQLYSSQIREAAGSC